MFMAHWTSKFCAFCINGVLLWWFIKAKPYLITELHKGLNCASQKYCKKIYLSPVNLRDCPCKTLLQTFKLDTTSMQGLIANLNFLFHDLFVLRCNWLYSFLSWKTLMWSTRWSMDPVPCFVYVLQTRMSHGSQKSQGPANNIKANLKPTNIS